MERAVRSAQLVLRKPRRASEVQGALAADEQRAGLRADDGCIEGVVVVAVPAEHGVRARDLPSEQLGVGFQTPERAPKQPRSGQVRVEDQRGAVVCAELEARRAEEADAAVRYIRLGGGRAREQVLEQVSGHKGG